ncbi:MAG: glutathione S-transferase [Gammaproteobacteria bacterium]|nr:MAG: glutathione S-transferase [Gammaproteobacteria bacterium]
MNTIADHPVNSRWPAENPDVIQLYSLATPNGLKAALMLEECSLPFEAHRIGIAGEDADNQSEAFAALNPNRKIPAIIDPDGPDGKPLALWESGAILVYLAEKTGQFLPADPAGRYETLQWLMFQMGGVGPMFGQFGFFNNYGGKDMEDRLPHTRYRNEVRRLLGVLEQRLEKREYLMGDDYTIADIATLPWVNALDAAYQAKEVLALDDFTAVNRWLDHGKARPAFERARQVTPIRR